MNDPLLNAAIQRLRNIPLCLDETAPINRVEFSTCEQAYADLTQALTPSIPPGLARHLIHEAMLQQQLQIQLTRALVEDGVLIKRNIGSEDPKTESVGAVHPAVEAIAKANERYRKIWKELLAYTTTENAEPQKTQTPSYPKRMQPLLQKAKGALEYALERRKSKKLSGEIQLSTQRRA